MIKAAVYCRVSTDKSDQINSFEAQQRYFREYIEQRPDWELYAIYADEGITGTSTKKRMAFNRMIQDAYSGKFQLIVTKEVSRFSRNILDTISFTRSLKAAGVFVFFVTDGIHTGEPDAELHLSIRASIAQEESRKTSQRVIWGQTRQMERGIVFGSSLLGYDVKNGSLFVEPEGAETVRKIFHMYAVEQVGTVEIARYLTQNGYQTKRGNTKWNSNGIIKILTNEKYVGDLLQKKTYTEDYLTHQKKINHGQMPQILLRDHHVPIISRDIWGLAQQTLKKNRKQSPENSGHSNRYAFSGKIRCGECGASFVGRTKQLKDGTCIRRWCCSTAARKGSEECSIGNLLRDDDAWHLLQQSLECLPLDTSSIAHNVTALAMEGLLTGEEKDESPDRLNTQIQQLRKKKAAVMDSYFTKEISVEDMQTMASIYQQQIKALQEKLTKAELQKNAANQEHKKTLILQKTEAILTCETKSDVFCKTILEQISVYKDRHMELRLRYLPQVFFFAPEKEQAQLASEILHYSEEPLK